jgi:Glycosyl transferase family 2
MRNDGGDIIERKRGPRAQVEELAFFECCYELFRRATTSAGEVRHTFRITDRTVCLAFAGTDLVPHITPALEHLRAPDATGPADVTLCIWDSLSTGTPMPPLPCREQDLTDRGDIWGFHGDRIKTAFHWDEASVNLFDCATSIGLYCVPRVAALPYWVRSAPLRTLFHWWMERDGYQLLHAAAVGAEGAAALLVGKGGAGKSTAALTCLQHGLRYLADDYVVVRLDPEPAVHSLYSTAKLNPDQLENFPDFKGLVRNVNAVDEKAVIYLHPRFGDQIAKRMPLRAILAPVITGGDVTRLRPASSWHSYRAVSFDTMSQLPHVGGHTHATMCRLATRVPGHTLEAGRVLREIPRVIAALLAETPRRPAQPDPSCAPACAARHPLVSVVMPVLDADHIIGGATDRILAQEYPAVELLIIDRGFTDRVQRAAAKLPCDVRYFKMEGTDAASARNRGIQESAGEIIAFFDVGDPWPDRHLAPLVAELVRRPGLDVVHACDWPSLKTPAGRRSGDLRDAFQFSIGMAACRKSAFRRTGLFDPTLSFGDAYDWLCRASAAGIEVGGIEVAMPPEGRRRSDTLRAFKTALDRRRAIETQIRGSA